MAALAIEFLLLFVAGPALFVLLRPRISPIPVLWAVMAYCLAAMLRDPKFDRARLWDPSGLRQHAPAILSLFVVITAIGVALMMRYAPGRFLNLPRSNPVLWAVVMVLYPLLSVYPQGIIYRAFLFERYRSLFGSDWGVVVASAAAFAFVHIVFRNPLAVALTLPAGLLFAVRYWQTGSLLASSFEHALYGCVVFTALQRRRGRPEQQGQSHYQKIARFSHLPRSRTRPISLTWQASRTGSTHDFF